MSSSCSEHEDVNAAGNSNRRKTNFAPSTPATGGTGRRRRRRRRPGGQRKRRSRSNHAAAATAAATTATETTSSKSAASCRLCANSPSSSSSSSLPDPVSEVEMQLLEGPSGLRAHYLCLLFSSGLHQRGEEDEGLRGFLGEDVRAEVRRGNRLKCVYCKGKGATVGCARSQCKKSYHLPCGMRNSSLQQHFDQFKSFCSTHRPAQKVEHSAGRSRGECGICLGEIQDPNPTFALLWAPCCSRWMHRSCIQRQALSAGSHHFRCIYCNDAKTFVREMRNFGIQIPERDASWERTSSAADASGGDLFSDLSAPRPLPCSAKICLCESGRRANVADGLWEVLACAGCGSRGIHVRCGGLEEYVDPDWYCYTCRRVVEIREGGFSKPIRTVWGAARGTRSGSASRSALDQKQELFQLVETMVIPVPRFIASSSSSSSPRKAPVDATTYVHNTHVNIRQIRRDPMDVTLEDLIVDGLDQKKKVVVLPPPSSVLSPIKRPRPSTEEPSSSSSPTASPASSNEDDRAKASSPGDSDYESGKEIPAKIRKRAGAATAAAPASTVGEVESGAATAVGCARESLDEKIQRSIKDFFLGDQAN